MDILLYIAAAYLIFTTIVLIRNWFEFDFLSDQMPYPEKDKKAPLVSICIPARNEENVIERCVTSALKQNYSNFEVLVLDDNSTDRTSEILGKLSGMIANLIYIKGESKPGDWHGKPWACHQLSKRARGGYLVFIDADVWLEEDAVTKAVSALQESDTITIWPRQHFGTFWEKMIIPLVYHALFTLLPAIYVEQNPKWMPGKLKAKFAPNFAAACGQFIAFNRNVYDGIHGHQSVKDEIIEDVVLSKNIKANGFSLKMYLGVHTVNCRMYNSHAALWQGFRKNFFAGFQKNIFLFLIMAALQLIVFVLPYVLLFTGDPSVFYLSAWFIGIIMLQRWVLDYRFTWNPFISLLQPISVLWYQALGIRCLLDYFSGKKVRWKDRNI